MSHKIRQFDALDPAGKGEKGSGEITQMKRRNYGTFYSRATTVVKMLVGHSKRLQI
jgi:hypothetical protein